MKILPKQVKEMVFLPSKSEANLQAEFYSQCKVKGIPCFLEYSSYRNGYGGTEFGFGARFDAVLHYEGKIVALCEFKQSLNLAERRRTWVQGSQGLAYLSWGVTVFLLLEEKDFEEVWDYWGEVVLRKPTEG